MSQESVKAAQLNTIESIKANPDAARAVYLVDTKLVEDVRCSAKVRDFALMTVDQPLGMGGQNTAMSPMELLLVALGSCQEIMYAAYASVMGIPLSKVEVRLKGYLDKRGMLGMDGAVPSGFQKVSYEVTIDSVADEATLNKLIETVENHCPATDTFVRPIAITGTVSINGGPMKSLREGAVAAA
jgi:putative redox protein